MKADIRYQIFLSSTYDDLRVERQQATQAILEMDHMPAGMELFPASDLSQWELIKAVINESDYYIVIVAGRYGSVHRDTGLSFTEMEYDYAVAQGIPVLGFVRKDLGSIKAGFSESDPVAKAKLDKFRQKVMGRICRQFDEPVELGMHVMKSLMSETRTNPRIGWIRADQARGREDVEREQALIDEVGKKDKEIKRLERRLRDRIVPLEGIEIADLAQGDDLYHMTVIYQDAHKKTFSENVPVTWDEMFSVIGPTMYGYVMRRGRPSYNKLVGQYSFEGNLVEYVRTKIIDKCGRRQIEVLSHQVDEILLQFKQLGLVEMQEINGEDDKEDFRGYALTVAGEEYLTRLKIKVRS